MYNTSVAYREAIQGDIRDFRIKGVITTLEDETIEFDDSDVVVGSYKHNASSQPGELFQHGGAVAKDMQIEIFDRDFDDNNPVLKSLSGGTIEPQIGVVLNIEANRNLSYNSDFTKPLTSDWNSHYGTQSIVNNKFTYTVTEQNSNTRVEYVTPILEPGDYTFSMYSKNNSQLVFKNFDGSTYNTKFVSINDDYSLSHTTLKVLEKQQVVIRIYLLDANIGDTLQIDKFKLEEGLFHTDWSEKTELQTVWIPMGKFIIDDFSQKEERMTIRAIDEMVYLDVDYQESNLTYPATLLQIYVNICNDIGIIPRTTSFINSSVVVTEKPTDTTYRNVLQYLAELSGTFAQMHRQGGLELKWYENQLDYEITADDRFEYNKDTFKANIPGVYYNVETGSGNDKKVTKMLVGQEEGALDLSNNKLLLNIVNKNDVINSVYNKINTIEFYPYVSSYVGDPSLDVGDIITQIDTRGNVFASPVTDLSFSFRGNQSIEGKGQDYTVKKFKG
ncbi:MAG TPA: hypothetical protein VFC79_12540, partial [Tissierellaceae bacterium]|nr:hypothetical protein [Tissierellaceae bacterium]